MRIHPNLIEITAELYELILDSYQPADRLMSHFFRNLAKMINEDRAFVAETVYGMLRQKYFLEFAEKNCHHRNPILAMVYLYLVLQDKESKLKLPLSPQELKEIKEVLKKANDNLFTKDPTSKLSIRYSIPLWILQRWDLGSLRHNNIEALCRSLQQPAPLYVRVNTLKITRKELKKLFETTERWKTQETRFSPVGLLFQNKTHVFKSPLFQKGYFEVQDEGSQLVSYLTEVKPGQKVLDACAGKGGKALHMASLMNNKGMIYAFDISEYRLKELKPRAIRAGVSNIRSRFLFGKALKKTKHLRNMFDVVLVDAPCSGIGTLRRNPDIPLKLSHDYLRELTIQQAEILKLNATFVKPGGRLIYVTCSLLDQENEEMVASFLQKYPEFHLVPVTPILQKQGISLPMKDDYLRLYPHLHNTDGFFAAVLVKS